MFCSQTGISGRETRVFPAFPGGVASTPKSRPGAAWTEMGSTSRADLHWAIGFGAAAPGHSNQVIFRLRNPHSQPYMRL